MQYLVFDDMTQCTQAEVVRLLPLVNTQRREQALCFSHIFGQFCCLKSYEMLCHLLDDYYASRHTEWSREDFIYNEYGQPILPHGPKFSISHCRNGIAVAVSERPIGIDIETIRSVKPDLIRKTMNISEQQTIANAPQPNVAFTCLWTQKEALLKLRGTGIISNLQDVLSALSLSLSPASLSTLHSISSLPSSPAATPIRMQTHSFPNRGYVLTIASEE